MAAIAPMDLITRDEPAANTIPLKCCVCPKKPTFSDLSHLLTHVSSKSHLSHKYKKKLRKDDQSVRDYREYKEWESRYGINDLAAERLFAKEQKTKGVRRDKKLKPLHQTRNARERRELADGTILMKAEPEDFDQLEPMTTPWVNSASNNAQYSVGRQNTFDVPGYHTPVLKRVSDDFSAPGTPDLSQSASRRSLSGPEIAESIETSELAPERQHISDDDGDLNKLKGIIYPGMGLFDSASEYQKRRRNQRKDESVLKNMIETSATITATECVWDEDGDLRRKRDIYATPSVEGTPERVLEEREKEKKKKRVRRTIAPTVRRTSARTARKTAAIAKRDANQDDDIFDDFETDNRNRFTNHTHGSAEGLRMFHDPPKRSPNTQGLFDYRRRPPLRPLSTNMSLGSTATEASKPLSFFPPRESGSSTFSTQQLMSNSTYYTHPQHTMGGGNYNPLCQTRSTQFSAYGFTGYGNDSKVAIGGFQAISTMAPPSLNNLAFNTYNQFESQETASERLTQDFDA
ncbi:hypothetical protein QBC38DRAFT_364098 [Podospora fimiseda]|uniref:Uncharacterized protein n=1 Tax=Podospora fimiseda TaxID=252190 RepID=A0AAN7H4T8_9PEZI|nr:hypothetical protein QBC38DRAFT_364098 [Podospora fimiseda]